MADAGIMAFPALRTACRLLVLASLLLWVRPPLAGGRQQDPAQPTNAQPGGALGAAAAPRESWEGVSWRLALSLVDPNAEVQEEPLFVPKAWVRRFGQTESASPAALRGRFSGWKVLGVQSFEYPNATLAADTGTMLKRLREQDAAAIPELLAQAMTPRPDETQAAEQTASRWVTSALSPERGDQLALLVLWDPREPERPMFERLTFLLIKAGRLSDGRFRVSAVCYGTAQQAVLDGV